MCEGHSKMNHTPQYISLIILLFGLFIRIDGVLLRAIPYKVEARHILLFLNNIDLI